MSNFAEVKFKGTRKEYFTYSKLPLKTGSRVVVTIEGGLDCGEVTALGIIAERKCGSSSDCSTPSPKNSILRIARASDILKIKTLRKDEDRVRKEARKLVRQHALEMKITEAEWRFDRKKLAIYFTADQRVDFRKLLRVLAKTFRTLIELKQIGVRDEAALIGGVGRCGRELCCSTWLPELKPVSLKLAKDQSLSLNPSQISGCCGRLMCCLIYEHQTYVDARRRFPRVGKIFKTVLGEESVRSVDILADSVTLISSEGKLRTLPLKDLEIENDRNPG
jgi:cell fate regulator YaaT (PSP1 superfamily)